MKPKTYLSHIKTTLAGCFVAFHMLNTEPLYAQNKKEQNIQEKNQDDSKTIDHPNEHPNKQLSVKKKTNKHKYAQLLPPSHLHILITWDGGFSLTMWEELLHLAKDIPIKHSFFVSGVYYLADDQKTQYLNHMNRSRSDIGFGGTQADIAQRIQYSLKALESGHEIASHLMGHYDGTNWQAATWDKEIKQFQDVLYKTIGSTTKTVRFPLLADNTNVYEPLLDHGFRSIFSHVDSPYDSYTLYKDANNRSLIIHPIPGFTSKNYRTISMDYNMWMYDKKHRPNMSTDDLAELVCQTYLEEAKVCKTSNRPLIISHHFSKFNRGVYLNGLKKFLYAIKDREDVKFITVSELDSMIEAHHG